MKGLAELRAGVVAIACFGGSLGASACFVADTSFVRPEFVRAVDADSEKAVSVVHNPRLDSNEPAAVTRELVGRGMLASGLFSEDDVAQLAAPIAVEIGRMAAREQLRIVAWAEDGPRVYYAWVHGGKLRLAYYKGADELERHEVVVPAEAVAMAPSRVAPEAPAPEVPPPAPSIPLTASARPAPAPTPVVRVAAVNTGSPARPPAVRPPAPLTEEQARQKLKQLDELLAKNLITPAEYKRGKRDILIRL